MIARELERRGIVTVSFGLTRNHLEAVKPPRSIFVKWPFGNPLGEPHNREQQLTMIFEALILILDMVPPGTIRDIAYRWKRHRFSEPDFTTLKTARETDVVNGVN